MKSKYDFFTLISFPLLLRHFDHKAGADSVTFCFFFDISFQHGTDAAQIPTKHHFDVNRLLSSRRSIFRHGPPDAARLRNLVRRVKKWVSDVEAEKRHDERYGLHHRPRSQEEIQLLHTGETRGLKEAVLQGVDTLRAIVSNAPQRHRNIRLTVPLAQSGAFGAPPP